MCITDPSKCDTRTQVTQSPPPSADTGHLQVAAPSPPAQKRLRRVTSGATESKTAALQSCYPHRYGEQDCSACLSQCQMELTFCRLSHAPKTAGGVAQPATCPSAQRARVSASLERSPPLQRTPPTCGARHRLPARMPLPRLPPRTHAAPAHPARRNGPNAPAPRMHPERPRKQGFPHMAGGCAGLWQ
jgi:hypothetical protein